MRQCIICKRYMKAMKCPHDGWPTLRMVPSSGEKIGLGTLLSGRYAIDEELGHGAYGEVYGGVDTKTQQPIAVKVLNDHKQHSKGTATRRFVREATITAGLTHGNIIRVFDYGKTEDNQLFIVMERLEGESVHTKIKRLAQRNETMSAAEVVQVGTGALQGLGAAHDRELIHRDIKPENLFLHRLSTGGEIVKLLDFGIVRPKSSTMTTVGLPIGTPTHMSPEQAKGDTIDGRSDLYSLGVVLYECASGKLPFPECSSSMVTMMLHISEPLPLLSETAPGFNPAVASVIHKALAKLPEDRWQTAKEMRDALRHAFRPLRRTSSRKIPQIPPSPATPTSPTRPTRPANPANPANPAPKPLDRPKAAPATEPSPRPRASSTGRASRPKTKRSDMSQTQSSHALLAERRASRLSHHHEPTPTTTPAPPRNRTPRKQSPHSARTVTLPTLRRDELPEDLPTDPKKR